MKNRCILKKSVAILALIVSVAFSFEACAKETEDPAVIYMTTVASKVSFYVAGAKDISIDWGDGKKSNVNDAFFDDGYFMFSHEYSGTIAHNMVITGNVTKLYCSRIELTALDVSRNTVLTDLDCSRNQLTILDVSRSTTLTYLDCNNNQLTALGISRSTVLTDLNCSNNQLTTLDVSKNTVLKRLECDFNQITKLDVSKNTALAHLSCAINKLTASALNDLFGTLPHYPGLEYEKFGVIYISTYKPGPANNPGAFDCDRSIAEKKGWVFMSVR